MVDKEKVELLKKEALEIRKDLLRLCHSAGMTHIGGDLSCADIMTVLFFHVIKHNPKNPKWSERDRFIMSKGHASGCLYTTLAHRGYFSMDEPLENFDKLDSGFGTHPTSKVPGVELSSGSLGHGLPVSVGMALAARLNNKKHRIFVMIGDGESDEGSVWEAAMAAPHFKLGNLIAIMDRNGLSMDGFTSEVMEIEPVADKWKAFRWNVLEVEGNNIEALVDIFNKLPDPDSEKPTIIIAKTVKGKGVECMENNAAWHAGSISEELMNECIAKLDDKVSKGGN